MKINSDRGNAVLEFVAIGLVAQLLIFGFLLKIGFDFRSQLAAESIGRQALRAMQIGSGRDTGLLMASSTAKVFGIAPSELTVVVTDNCVQSGIIEIAVQVRSKTHVAKGYCLD